MEVYPCGGDDEEVKFFPERYFLPVVALGFFSLADLVSEWLKGLFSLGGVSSIRLRVCWKLGVLLVMDKRALEKASDRLRVAHKAYKKLVKCKNPTDFSDEWFTLVVALKSVWSKLQQGSKTSPQTRQWFGAKVRERKADEVLQYMFIARNDDEHGLDGILQYREGKLTYVSQNTTGKTFHMEHVEVDFKNKRMKAKGHDDDGNPIDTILPIVPKSFQPSTLILKYVKDRASQTVKAPDITPVLAAEKTLKDLSGLIDEAREMHKP